MDWHPEPESASFANLAIDTNRSTVRLYYGLADWQTESGASLLAAVRIAYLFEPLKDSIALICGHAAPMVGHFELNPTINLLSSD